MKKIFIKKASGKHVPFERSKVEATCIRAGASKQFAEKVSRKVQVQLYEGISTKEVYKLVLKQLALADKDHAIQHRYRLKESIMLMGPAGFPFEVFIKGILQHYGHHPESIREKMQGQCVIHEIDIITTLENGDKCMIECKYHNSPGIFTGIKESLYTHARFLDLKAEIQKEMLVSNTKISSDALQYAQCVGQKILCWKYPLDNGLEKIIEKEGLYPITILKLQARELEEFSKNHIMIAKDLLTLDLMKFSRSAGISLERLKRLQRMAQHVISSKLST